MERQKKFIKHYEEGFMPWAHEEADFNLTEVVSSFNIEPVTAIEVGCGTGTDAIWLAKRGFKVTGVDVSPLAIKMATDSAKNQNADASFEVVDIVNEPLPHRKFSFAFDRGFFHSFDNLEERTEIVKKIHKTLSKDGLWLSLIGNADGEKTSPGPPLRKAQEIVSAVEPYFEILQLRSSFFGNGNEKRSRNWVCLMKKRDPGN